MNIGLLGGIIFVVVFAGIILVHELGHFFVARLMKIEVEEFGFGFPPRLLRLWRGRGSILVGKDRVVIPINFDLTIDPKQSLHRQVNIVAVSKRNKLVLRSITIADNAEWTGATRNEIGIRTFDKWEHRGSYRSIKFNPNPSIRGNPFEWNPE